MERWLPVVGWEEFYEVSDLGRVRRAKAAKSTRVGRIRKTPIRNTGYPCVTLSGGGRLGVINVHRLVLEAFTGPAPSIKHVTRHLDGNPLNNTITNLAWGTEMENAQDKERHGRTVRGEKQWMAKLTTGSVCSIRAAALSGESQCSIAKRLGLSQSWVSRIVMRRAWKHVEVFA